MRFAVASDRFGVVTKHRRTERALVAVVSTAGLVRVGAALVDVTAGSLDAERRAECVHLHGQACVHRQQPEQDG
ncbi:hypothetical protein CcI49_37210 [Frankia sp. CcI49]|uniref:hypothetical protein n=1 Tax=Frankia sp. CcI49 TaxID=1745382 RepID=UPI0009779992|nr:hypothetical protein [Frankia sp. CcI49]ONH50410.1 hypothetical protein CcI49_37210 [Frankia sp. CcI49]